VVVAIPRAADLADGLARAPGSALVRGSTVVSAPFGGAAPGGHSDQTAEDAPEACPAGRRADVEAGARESKDVRIHGGLPR